MNGIGYESANDLNSAEGDIPWLQDNEAQDLWNRWLVGYRDVRVLDDRNRLVATYNLTVNNLADNANRDALKQILLDAAGE